MTTKKKEEYIISREVQVDGKKSDLAVKITFDTEKGTIAITPKVTTKHLSFDEVQRGAVLQQVGNMIAEAYDFSINLIENYLEANRPESHGQMSLLDAIAENSDDLPFVEDDEPAGERETDGEVKKVRVRKS